MAVKKNRKRRHSRAVELKRQQEQENNDKSRNKKRLDPTARLLLYGDLVFLAVCSLLDHYELISAAVGGACTILGVILLLAALWFQFRPKGDGFGTGPRL